MSRRTAGVVAAVITSTALAGSGLVVSTAQAARPGADRSSVTVVHIGKGAPHMPTTIRAGLHTFKIKGTGQLQLLKVHGTYSNEQLVRDVNKGINGGKVKAIRRFERHVTWLGGGAKGTATFRVPRGKFLAVNSGGNKAKTSQILVGHAVGVTRAGLPTGTGTITAVDDNKWSTTDASTIPASGRLLFRNASHDNHFVVFGKLLPGKTVTDFGNWVNAFNANPATAGDPPVDQRAPGFFNAVVGPGRSLANSYSLPAGNYIVACFYPDADMGGMEHVFMGMYRGITLQ